MYKGRFLLSILAVLLGIALGIFSEYDDAPGGVLLGFLLIVAGAVGMVKSKRKKPDFQPKEL